MVLNGTAFKELGNGQEKLTDGLWTHRGRLSVGPATIAAPNQHGDINANRGDGTGVYYFAGDGSKYLFYNGTYFYLSGGPLKMAAGSATSYLGSYYAGSDYRPPTPGTWNESDVQVTTTWSGAPLHIEWQATLWGAGLAHDIVLSLGIDGAIAWNHVGRWSTPYTNSFTTLSGVMHHRIPPAGVHRLSLFVYTGSAGSGLWSGAMSALWLTELRA